MDINSPKTTDYTGEVTNVSPVITKEYTNATGDKKTTSFRMVTVQTPSGIIQKPVNESFYQRRNSDLTVGKFVTLTFEQRIKDTTEYADANGDVQKHTSTSEGITNVTVGSNFTARYNFAKEEILKAEGADKAALATLLAGMR